MLRLISTKKLRELKHTSSSMLDEQAQIDTLNSTIAALERKVANLRTNNSGLRKQVEQLHRAVQKAKTHNKHLRAENFRLKDGTQMEK